MGQIWEPLSLLFTPLQHPWDTQEDASHGSKAWLGGRAMYCSKTALGSFMNHLEQLFNMQISGWEGPRKNLQVCDRKICILNAHIRWLIHRLLAQVQRNHEEPTLRKLPPDHPRIWSAATEAELKGFEGTPLKNLNLGNLKRFPIFLKKMWYVI